MSNTNFFAAHHVVVAGSACVCMRDARGSRRAGAAAAARDDADTRWQPWLGCWSATPPRFVDLEAEPQQVCVVPAAGTAAVDVVTVTGSKIVSRERIDPNGEHRPGEREGCTGWDSAQWSADMRRVYLQSEYTCTGGVKRATTGLMASAANGDWLDIVGVGLRDKVGVRVLRHRRERRRCRLLPPEIAAAVARDSREPAALRALLPVGDAEIIDASKHVSGAVIEAWLAENRQKFTMNGKRLTALANAGVEDRVLDMLVALSYPEAFAIKPSPTMTGELAIGGGGERRNGVPECVSVPGGRVHSRRLQSVLHRAVALRVGRLFARTGSTGTRYGAPPYGYYGGGWYEAGGGGGIIVGPIVPPLVTGARPGRERQGLHVRRFRGIEREQQFGRRLVVRIVRLLRGGSSGGGFSGSSGGDRTAVPR